MNCTYPRGSVCNNTIGGYECVCPPGYIRCSSECIRKLSGWIMIVLYVGIHIIHIIVD